MKNVFVLIFIAILQLISSSLYSCEINTNVQSNISTLSVSEKNQKTSSALAEKKEQNKKTNMAESHQDRCSKCISCNEVLLSSTTDEINFLITTQIASNFSYISSYKSPFINFDPKPPCFNFI
ncbi:MAG: hypothetical protein KBD76_14005 [Bacteriovorax sp.]|nr:hypothetical protein [Bacteriovorax sp.]